MLSLQLEEFMVELKDGSIKNVGPPNKSATAKLYDVDSAQARKFGDERVKFAFEDEGGNVVHVALSPSDALSIVEDVRELRDGRVFENGEQ
jgi:hypothetical protein